jgi:hypothetical protein
MWQCGIEDDWGEKDERKREREDKKETLIEGILKGKGMEKLMIRRKRKKLREEGGKMWKVTMRKRVLKDKRGEQESMITL